MMVVGASARSGYCLTPESAEAQRCCGVRSWAASASRRRPENECRRTAPKERGRAEEARAAQSRLIAAGWMPSRPCAESLADVRAPLNSNGERWAPQLLTLSLPFFLLLRLSFLRHHSSSFYRRKVSTKPPPPQSASTTSLRRRRGRRCTAPPYSHPHRASPPFPNPSISLCRTTSAAAGLHHRPRPAATSPTPRPPASHRSHFPALPNFCTTCPRR